MPRIAICSSPKCAHCVELPDRENATATLNRVVCPRCQSTLFSRCPHCYRPLLEKPDARLPRCSKCGGELKAWPMKFRANFGFDRLIGTTAEMQRVYRQIEKARRHEYPVLILGESGTGKELVARSIHFGGPRKNEPFVPVDCSALVPTLVESELFGHVKGAFTGADQAKRGLLEAARGGTVFLDEIGDMPVELQAKLLRVLQEQEIKPVGSTESHPINARFIAATNRDPEAAIRQDLYFRLNVVQVKLPPLRERRKDIPLLVAAFLERLSGSTTEGTPAHSLSEEAMRQLMSYHWPGNVRELENAIRHALSLESGPVVGVADLPSRLHRPSGDPVTERRKLLPLRETERHAILSALRQTGGDKLAAARLLGIGKTTLYRRLKRYREENAKSSGESWFT